MSENFQFISHQLKEHMVKSEENMTVEEDNDYEVDNQLTIKPEIDMNLLDQQNSGTDSAEEEEVDDDQQESSSGQQIVSNVVFNEGDQIMTSSSLGSDQSTSNADKPSAVILVKLTKCWFTGCPQLFADMKMMAEHCERDHKQASSRKKNITPRVKPYKPTEAVKTVVQSVAGVSGQKTMPTIVVREVAKFLCCFLHCNQVFPNKNVLKHHLEVSHNMIVPKVTKKQSPEAQDIPPVVRKRDNWKIENYINAGTTINIQLKQAIINLKTYIEDNNPSWRLNKVTNEISKAIYISASSVRRVIDEYRKNKEFKREVLKKGRKTKKFTATDEDRLVLDKCIDKLKSENRLNSAFDVLREINSSDEFNVSFKGCSSSIFYRIFQRMGYKITETMIVSKKSSGDWKTRSKDGDRKCSWPGCDKVMRTKMHYEEHVRVHTREKPYQCRQPGCQYRCSTYPNFLKHLKGFHKMSIKKTLTVEQNKCN